jgi:hypothetical protein
LEWTAWLVDISGDFHTSRKAKEEFSKEEQALNVSYYLAVPSKGQNNKITKH